MQLGVLRDEVPNGVVLLLDDKVGAIGDSYSRGVSLSLRCTGGEGQSNNQHTGKGDLLDLLFIIPEDKKLESVHPS